MTFGAGAVLGGIAGAVGARKLTRLYNAEKGVTGDTVRWSEEFMEARLEGALVRYLAVAHFGRGRGDFQLAEAPGLWREAVGAALRAQASVRSTLWAELRADPAATARLAVVVENLLTSALRSLYPDAANDFAESSL
jgi:hypothetical protein